jgi:hypothetical protein
MPVDMPFTGSFAPKLNFAGGVMQVGYDDVASCLLTVLSGDTETYNRGMMAIAPKA